MRNTIIEDKLTNTFASGDKTTGDAPTARTGLALCHRVTLDPVAHWWVPARTPTVHQCLHVGGPRHSPRDTTRPRLLRHDLVTNTTGVRHECRSSRCGTHIERRWREPTLTPMGTSLNDTKFYSGDLQVLTQRAVKCVRCSTCERMSRSRGHRPSRIPTDGERFNLMLFVDLCHLVDVHGKRFGWLVAVDQHTDCTVIAPCPSHESQAVAKKWRTKRGCSRAEPTGRRL